MSADPGAAAASLHQLPDGVAQRASALPGHAPRRATGRARVRQQHPSQRRARANSGTRLAAGASAPRWPPESWTRAQESVALRHGGAMIEAGLMMLGDGGILHPALTLAPLKERYALRAEAKGQTQQSERASERNDRTPFYPARVR
jgi:hypothetical protein